MKIEHVIAFAEVLPSGQKTTAAFLEFDEAVKMDQDLLSAFSVKERRITDVYVNDKPEKTHNPCEGKYIIICLDPADEKAATVNSGPPKNRPGAGGPPKDGPGAGGPPKDGPMKPQGPKPGPGMKSERMVHRTPEAEITVCKEIMMVSGMCYESKETLKSDQVIQDIVDDFKQFQYNGIPYNLFIPKNYDGQKTYPLVLFMHDAEPCGEDPLLTLVQGIGAIRFASPEDQKKHECFVLAPEIPVHLRPLEEECEDDIATNMKPILDQVMEDYNIDRTRVYTTGQSGGCMASCELNHRYPDLFAASLLVAGQWDAGRMKNTAGNKYWITVSEHDVQAFPGMTAVTQALEEAGASVYRYHADAKDTDAHLNELAQEAIEKHTDVIFTVFDGDSVVPEGFPLNPITNHISTWQVGYNIDAIRDWLFTNHK
jgi:predicted peptidase